MTPYRRVTTQGVVSVAATLPNTFWPKGERRAGLVASRADHPWLAGTEAMLVVTVAICAWLQAYLKGKKKAKE